MFDFEWIDHFAAARNEALSHAAGGHAFWLDADDVVEPVEREKLRDLLERLTVCPARANASDDGGLSGALAACAKGLELDPKDAELWFRKGMVHRHRGESAEAEKCWRLILTLKRPDQFFSVDQGIYGHLTRRDLAVLAAERGDHAEAGRLWEAVLAECPGDREALTKMGQLKSRRPVNLINAPSR